MDEERLIELLIALHDGLPRQGPGDSALSSQQTRHGDMKKRGKRVGFSALLGS